MINCLDEDNGVERAKQHLCCFRDRGVNAQEKGHSTDVNLLFWI